MDCVGGLDVQVGDGLGVRQDTGGDHQGQHVDCNQEDCTDCKRDQQTLKLNDWSHGVM